MRKIVDKHILLFMVRYRGRKRSSIQLFGMTRMGRGIVVPEQVMALHGLLYEHLYEQAPAADWFMLSHMIRKARQETSCLQVAVR
jgi:hypothetical protein